MPLEKGGYVVDALFQVAERSVDEGEIGFISNGIIMTAELATAPSRHSRGVSHLKIDRVVTSND
jgi:hypothetical protein